ncbi:MAG: DUF1062 domain-containing protein [Lachnospiraceae bacterium]|nr:DUF1062 domain-containing protein [Lachnospiraceae bacterium]
MSYCRIIEYEIVPKESFSVIRGCAGCCRKTNFINTKKFRVNANGNKLDVWLIYQCESCRHTLNLTIYERKKASSIPKEEYDCFVRNEEELAEKYGRDMSLFQKNKAEIDFDRLHYDIVKLHDTTQCEDKDDGGTKEGGLVLNVHNTYGLKIRPEKQIAETLGMSRSQVQNMLREGELQWEAVQPHTISVRMRGQIFNQ